MFCSSSATRAGWFGRPMSQRWGRNWLRWPDFGREQLFNPEADPLEESDPAHATRLAAIRERCDFLKQSAQ